MLDNESTSFDRVLVNAPSTGPLHTTLKSNAAVGLGRIRKVKRGVDIAIFVFTAPFLLPILALCAIAVRLESRGPILFRQKRFGTDGREFVVTKFRTMKVEDTDQTGGKQAQIGDSRVTKVGRFLRRTCLDELPQVWDILRGEMSFVGPRPHPTGMRIDGVLMEDLYQDYHARLRLPPGLTGLSQINGNRGPIHDFEFGLERLSYDKEYIETWSLWMDLKILAKTPMLPFSKGCY